MNYCIFYTGVASTPNTIGLINTTTGEIIHNIETARPTGKETRRVFEKYKTILEKKYKPILN